MNPTLREWLEANDLAEFEAIFVENEVDLKTLEILTESDLKELGLAFGPRKRILNAIAGLIRQAASERAESETPAAGTAAGERRQLTVMFCDMVGSTALSTLLDPEELRELIRSYRRACRDVISQYDGHVAQFLGDGLMVYFGWPVAHEDAAERAVRSALGMVRAVKELTGAHPLSTRIGLATGMVVVSVAELSDVSGEKTALGQVPNLAARLQAVAGPDEVVIAPTTRQLLSDAFSCSDIGEHSLKGIAQPVRVWRVDDVRRTEARFQVARGGVNLAPMLGRDDESMLLARCWQQARNSEGQVVLIGGQPGIGKSRLTEGFRTSITDRHSVLRYQCSPYHLNSPLQPFIEEFEMSAAFARDDKPKEQLEKMEAALAASGAGIAEFASLYAALLSLPTDSYPPLQLSPRKQKEKTLEALISRVVALCAKSPVLMVLEDAHWIDPTSHELLEILVPKLLDLPVLLVITYRLEYEPVWVGQTAVTTLTLHRLERHEGAALVNTLTKGRALPVEVLDEIVTRTDGIPLFVEELTRSVLESGLLREEADRFVLLAPLSSLAIPVSLRDSLMARLDRLGSIKEFAQMGACIGREFSFGLLKRISMLRDEWLESSLEKLVESGLVTRRDSLPDATYTFKHALIQDAAYDSLLKTRRVELHARIAHVLESDFADQATEEPAWLAHHHTQAGNLVTAIPLWRKAGSLAVGRVALKEAVAHFQKGLTLTEQLPLSRERDRLELTIREPLNAAWSGLRGWAAPEVGANAAAILRLAENETDKQSLLLALWWVWTSTITQGRIADSRQWVARLLAEGKQAGDIELRMFGHVTAMVQDFLSGNLIDSRDETDRAITLWDPLRSERSIALTGHDMRSFVEVYACQLLWVMGFPEQAKLLSDQSVEDARADGHAFNLVWALTFSAYVFAYRREPDRFMERVDEADRLAREQGLAFIYQVSVPQARGIAELQRGRPREAIALLRQGIDRWTQTGGNVRVPLLKSRLAEATALDGDPETALQLLDECLEQINRPSGQERLWLAEVLRLKGWIMMREGRDEEAETQLRASIECARRQQAKSWELRGATNLATLLAKRGQREAAINVLAPVFAWFTEGAETKDLIEAKALLEELSS